MCGIVGIVGNIYKQHLDMFQDMLCFDFVRGKHSTGVLRVDMKGETFVEKELGHPQNLWINGETNIFDNLGVPKMSRALIGHNRHATKGGITVENAHPFEFGDIIGMHNGRLTDWDDLDGAKDEEVDSKALIQDIANNGVEATWSKFRGPATVVWWDKVKGTLNIARNSGRPLCFARLSSTAYVFASEAWMIREAAKRNRVQLLKEKSASGEMADIFIYHTDKWGEFHVTNTACRLDSAGYRELKSKPLPASSSQVYRGYDGYELFKKGGQNEAKAPLNTTWARGLEKAPKEVRDLTLRMISMTRENQADYDNFTVNFKVVGKGFENVAFRGFPPVRGQYGRWITNMSTNSMNPKLFQLKARPRVYTFRDYTEYRFSLNELEPSNVTQIPKRDTRESDLSIKHLPMLVDKFASTKDSREDWVLGPDGNKVSPLRWRELIKQDPTHGCCCGCGNPLIIEDAPNITWQKIWGKDAAFCEHCSEDPEILALTAHGYGGVRTWH